MAFTLAPCGGNDNNTSETSPEVEIQSTAPIESEPTETKDERLQVIRYVAEAKL